MPRKYPRSIRFPDPLETEVEKAAKEESRTFSNLVLLAVQQYLKSRTKQRAA